MALDARTVDSGARDARALLTQWACEAPQWGAEWLTESVTELHARCDANMAFFPDWTRQAEIDLEQNGADAFMEIMEWINAAMDKYDELYANGSV